MTSNKETILAVDDFQVNLQLLQGMLNNEYSIITANNGKDAIKIALEQKPDLILLDVMMPIMDGFTACKILKENLETKNIPVIFLTARTDKNSIIEGLQAGAVDYICKPFDRDELNIRIKNHLKLIQTQKKLEFELHQRIIAKNQLADKTKLLSLVTDNISDAVTICNNQGYIILASPSSKKIFRTEIANIIGKPIWDLAQNNNEKNNIHNFFNDVLNGTKTKTRFVFHNSKDNKYIVLESKGTVVYKANGEISMIMFDTNDITTRVKATLRFKKSTKLQNNLRLITANLAHINQIRKKFIYLVESLSDLTNADELILLLGRSDNNNEFYYINGKKNIKYGIIPRGENEYSDFIKILKNNNNEIVCNIHEPFIPKQISQRNRRYIIYPIIIDNKLIGIFYLGKNSKKSIQPNAVYSVITITSLLKSCINKINFEQKISSKELQLRQLFESSANAIVIVDSNYVIERHNSRFIEMFGFQQNNLSSQKISSILKGDILKRITKLLDETLNNSKYETVEIPFLNPQGIKKFYEITASKINLSNTQTVCLLLITDITKLKDMDKTIFSTITSTEEKERTRMARELHDGLGALLSSINIYINLVLSDTMEKEEILNTLSLTKSLVGEAIQNVKEIANNLHPVILTRFGLVETIKAYIEQLESTKIIKFGFTYSEFQNLKNKDLELTLYRILCELINNTLKYAQAKNVAISLSTQPTSIQLEYADDGKGLDINKIKSESLGMGLSNIEGRIKALNGTCNFITKYQKGFRVFIEIPYIATQS
ncbi:MAG: response regulator [Bacteroidales bacterium]|nr:response regulator [Bacteroidales bacterium]